MTRRRLLLVGGGHAHLEVLRRLGAEGLPPGWEALLLTREAASPYSGMLPGVISGHYRAEEALFDTARLAAHARAARVLDAATGLDPASRLLHRAGGPPIAYDLLSIDTGAVPDTARTPGAAAHALPLKPIDRLLPRLSAPLGPRIAVVGAGAAGTEVALALAARDRGAAVTLVAGAAGLLPGYPAGFRSRARAALARVGVALREGEDAAEVAPGEVRFAAGPPLGAESILWAAGAAAPPWLAETGLPRDAAGFLRVDRCLRAEGHGEVFVAGDAAAFPDPLPKAGVHAVRQGPVLAGNLLRAMRGEPPLPYRPQRHILVLLATGTGHAIATRNGLSAAGRWAWWWKDRIDRSFMRRYQALG